MIEEQFITLVRKLSQKEKEIEFSNQDSIINYVKSSENKLLIYYKNAKLIDNDMIPVLNLDCLKKSLNDEYNFALREEIDEKVTIEKLINLSLKYFAKQSEIVSEFYKEIRYLLQSEFTVPLKKLRENKSNYEHKLQLFLHMELVNLDPPNFDEINMDEPILNHCLKVLQSLMVREKTNIVQNILSSIVNKYSSSISPFVALLFEEIGQPMPVNCILSSSMSPNNDTVIDQNETELELSCFSSIGSESFLIDQSSNDISKRPCMGHKRSFTSNYNHIVTVPINKKIIKQKTTPKKINLKKHNHQTTPKRKILKTKMVKETPKHKQKSGDDKRKKRAKYIQTPEAKKVVCIEESPVIENSVKRTLLEKRFILPISDSKRQLFSPIKSNNVFDTPKMDETSKTIINVRKQIAN